MIMDRFERHGISWRNYYTDLPRPRGCTRRVVAERSDKLVDIDQFYTDAAAGKLPAVCFVDPDFDTDSPRRTRKTSSVGEAFAAKRHQRGDARAAWAKTLLI